MDVCAPLCDIGQDRRRLADRRHGAGAFRHHGGSDPQGQGFTPERLAELARQAFAWALPNVLLGALIIVPIWFVAFLFRPPGTKSE